MYQVNFFMKDLFLNEFISPKSLQRSILVNFLIFRCDEFVFFKDILFFLFGLFIFPDKKIPQSGNDCFCSHK